MAYRKVQDEFDTSGRPVFNRTISTLTMPSKAQLPRLVEQALRQAIIENRRNHARELQAVQLKVVFEGKLIATGRIESEVSIPPDLRGIQIDMKVIEPWEPIRGLPAAIPQPSRTFARLCDVWRERARELGDSVALEDYLKKVHRRQAIETGVIERLYDLDRGVTETLIQRGVNSSLISHEDAIQNSEWVAQMIQTQLDAIEGVFSYVKGEQEVSTSYIKSLHAQLTKHQRTTQARTPTGQLVQVNLIQGGYKQSPNNPLREDGVIHEYCPPVHTPAEMDRFVEFWRSFGEDVSSEVLAAWVHHRFTEIHPFQDGNGRVARCLASVVFVKAGLLPQIHRLVLSFR